MTTVLQPFTFTTTGSGQSTSPAYTIGDMVGTELTLSSAAQSSGSGGFITGITVEDDGATTEQLRLMFFNAASSPAADNAANSWADANMRTLEIAYDMPALTASALNSYAHVGNLWLPYVCATTSLFLNVVALTSYTSSSTTALNFKIKTLQWT